MPTVFNINDHHNNYNIGIFNVNHHNCNHHNFTNFNINHHINGEMFSSRKVVQLGKVLPWGVLSRPS